MKNIFLPALGAMLMAFSMEASAQTKTTLPQDSASTQTGADALSAPDPGQLSGSQSTSASLEKPVKKPRLVKDRYGYYQMNTDNDRGSNASLNGYDPGWTGPASTYSAPVTEPATGTTTTGTTTETTTESAPESQSNTSVNDAWGSSGSGSSATKSSSNDGWGAPVAKPK